MNKTVLLKSLKGATLCAASRTRRITALETLLKLETNPTRARSLKAAIRLSSLAQQANRTTQARVLGELTRSEPDYNTPAHTLP